MDQRRVSHKFPLSGILRCMIMIIVSYFGFCLTVFHLGSTNVIKESDLLWQRYDALSTTNKARRIKIFCQFETKRALREKLRCC